MSLSLRSFLRKQESTSQFAMDPCFRRDARKRTGKRIKLSAIMLGGMLIAAPAYAQSETDLAHLSVVAGYKAAFTCSAHFNAGRTVEQISGDELNRIYPDYREAMALVSKAFIDEEKKTVSVRYLDGYPPRVAAWRPYLGCAQLPSGADPQTATNLPVITAKWKRSPAKPLPENLSDNAALLDTVVAAFDHATYGGGTETTAVLVVQRGQIIAEKYRDGFGPDIPQRTWSVAKSIAATVIGAATQEGYFTLSVQDGWGGEHLLMGDKTGLAEWSSPDDPRQKIRMDDVLRMASGLDSWPAGNRTDDVYFGGGRVVDHALTRRLISYIGLHWRYSNNDSLIAMRALRERIKSDQQYLRYPFLKVLFPLGMDHTFLETDWNGDFVMSSQVWTTARDLARLGLLYLNNGVWDGKRILPERWAEYVSSGSWAQPPRERSDGSQRPNYGAQFWLFGPRHGLPEGTYAAMGNRGQYLVIIPERNVVIVRRGFDDGGGFDIARFSADVLATLED